MVIIVLVIVFALARSRNKPRPGLYDSAMPKEGKPVHPTRTIPRRATTVAPGTHFPMDEVRRSDDGEGDFATSAMVAAATGSLPSGAMDCGSGISSGIGSDCGGGGD